MEHRRTDATKIEPLARNESPLREAGCRPFDACRRRVAPLRVPRSQRGRLAVVDLDAIEFARGARCKKPLVERATEAGALAYVVKPFTPNDLLPAIEIALARYAQIITLEAEVTDLVERFETRKLVDRAKGLLNEKMGLTEPEAFRWIQKASMDRRLTMHDVAQAIIEQLSAKK